MADFSHFGRTTHPEFATQTIFGPDFDDILQALWDQNAGNLAWRLARLAEQGALPSEPSLVLREMLAMVNCHSKSRVPVETLSEPQELRRVMQERAETDLRQIYHTQQIRKLRQALQAAQEEENHADMDRFAKALYEAEAAAEASESEAPSTPSPAERLRRYYADFRRDSFRWLVAPQEAARELASDVVDTLRALRCADALRQRGTVLKTSGGYEVFVDQSAANALFALRLGEDELFLLELSDRLAAGEANIASSELDRDGNLRISFHRGAFPDQETTRQAAYNAALIVNDIQADAIESFRRPAGPVSDAIGRLKTAEEMEILLEGVADNPEFATLVSGELARINPQAARCTRCVPSMQAASPFELARYLQAEALDWDLDTRRQALERIAKSGHRTEEVDPVGGFRDVKLVRVKAGEVLIEAGARSGFVYIPLRQGLRIMPLGGYDSLQVHPWMPLGITGVIRGATRNATVTAEQDLMLLMIPKEVYLREWHHTHSVMELTQLFLARRDGVPQENILTELEKRLILQTVPLFSEIPNKALAELAAIVRELRIKSGETVFEKGDRGDSMYAVVDGQVRVHDGQHILNHLGERDVFGEMALLDPEPRMASVTAVVDTHLLCLDEEAFHRLVAEQPEVALGIMRVLSRHLRDVAQDLTELRTRVKELTEVSVEG
jgi:CRP-like cAMP-binding protein